MYSMSVLPIGTVAFVLYALPCVQCSVPPLDLDDSIPNEVFQQITRHQYLKACWGQDAVKDFYMRVKQAQDGCNQMIPKDDLFTTFHYPDDTLIHKSSSPPQDVSQQHLSPQEQAAYNTWMEFLAFQQFKRIQSQNSMLQGRSGQAQKPRSLPIPYQFRRVRRGAIQGRPNAEDIRKFGMEIAGFKNFLSAGLSNLTCVLMTMGHLRKDFEVNEQYFLEDLWTQHAYNTDPEFQDKMIESYQQCLEFSHSVPQSILDKQPGEHWFKKQIVFFKCAKVMERKNCAKKQLSDHMTEWYGELDPKLISKLQLPEDRYEAGLLTFKVLAHGKSDTDKFVYNSIFGKY